MLQIQLVVTEADLNPGPPDFKSAPLTTQPCCLLHNIPPCFSHAMGLLSVL